METTRISDLADALIEHAWILCSPADAVANLAVEYNHVTSQGEPFMWGDDEVTPTEFISALAEIVEYFRERNIYPDGDV